MEDYYEIVGVDRNASGEVIDRKLREQLRTWQRRTSTADLARRQDAERRVQQLSEARAVLLDEEKRREYDRKLTAFRASEPPPAPPTSLDARMPDTAAPDPDPAAAGGSAAGGGAASGGAGGGGAAGQTATSNWLDQARGYLRDKDHHSAAYAARETLRSTPNPPAEAWRLLAEANAGLGRLDDALFEARRAVTTDSRNAEAQLTLARILEQRQEWGEARQAYEAAGRTATAPSTQSETAHLGTVRMLARSGRTASALDRLERRYAAAPDRQAAARVLARGLVEASRAALENAGSNRSGATTSGAAGSGASAEIGQVRRMLTRVREVSRDPEFLQPASELEQQLARRPPGQPGRPGPPGGASPRNYRRSGYGQPEFDDARYRTNSLAVVALVLSVLGLTTCGVSALVGAILGHVARGQIRNRGEQGDGMAIAAVVVGWLVVVGACCAGTIFYTSNPGF